MTTDNYYSNQARLFKVLAHPIRLAILALLREEDQCVCHIEAFLGYRQAYISQQLMVLRDAGLIEYSRSGLNIFYRIKDRSILPIIDSANEYFGTSNQTWPQTKNKYCSCPKCYSNSDEQYVQMY